MWPPRRSPAAKAANADPDPLWQEAVKLLAATQGIQRPPFGAAHPAASHSETKAVVWMRQSKITYVVAVINNRRGPCGEERVAGVPSRHFGSGEEFLAYLEAIMEDPLKL
jgi:hypothetical protein